MFRIFRHYIPKTLLMLGLAEALILMVSVYIGAILRLSEAEPHVGSVVGGDLFAKAGIFTLVMFAVMMAMGLYQRDSRDEPRTVLMRLGLSFGIGLLMMSIVHALDPALVVGNSAFAVALLASFVGIASCRFLCISRTDSRLSRRVLVLGVGEKAQQIAQLRRRTDQHGVTVVGFVDLGVDARQVDVRNIFSIRSTLHELVERHEIDEIVVALDDRRNKLPVDDILHCKMQGIEVIDAPVFFERQLGKIRLDTFQPGNVIFSDGFTQAVLKTGSKSLFDVAASLGLLLAAAPVMLLTVLAILLESRGQGPVLYRQERVGAFGRFFNVYKFRSMRVDAEKNGAVWARQNDDRVTLVGRFIRKTRIDELPQLFNVLKGDMSFVGPRPERPQFVSELGKAFPYYNLRHNVKPGITGWAQICYPYGASVDDSREKLQYDLYYLKNYSLFLDLTILLQTAQVILWGKGSR
jgi:sugar transferase (PEP-CTERM system associated)